MELFSRQPQAYATVRIQLGSSIACYDTQRHPVASSAEGQNPWSLARNHELQLLVRHTRHSRYQPDLSYERSSAAPFVNTAFYFTNT